MHAGGVAREMHEQLVLQRAQTDTGGTDRDLVRGSVDTQLPELDHAGGAR